MFRALAPLVLLFTLTLTFTTAACDGDGGEPAIIASIDVTPDPDTVQAGGTAQFAATARDASGNIIFGVTFTWISGSNAIATVDASGLATGVVAGSTEIRATADGITGSAVLVVIPNNNTDAPDDGFVDANGDGIDGDASVAIFVATSGDDANPGTRAEPKRTIAAAIAAAQADAGKSHVYVSSGTYSESVELVDAISLYGGYDAASDWARSLSNVATIDGDTIAVKGVGIQSLTFVDLFTIQSANNTRSGGNSTGVHLASSSMVRLRNLTITAGNGGSGATGNDGAQGALGLAGQDGAIPTGGAGGDTVTGVMPSGKGGDGGNGADVFPAAGGTGGDGLPQPGGGLGGAGGPDPAAGDPDACDINGLPGDIGGVGGYGLAGIPGGGGNGQGSVVSGYWRGSPGLDGAIGSPGFGGGGGGGGSAGREMTATVCQPVFGGGGGGGGSGGQAGEGAQGGQGGGGSFGIFVLDTSVQIERSDVTAGDGGDGGGGGTGGTGGTGGSGGLGSNGDMTQGGLMGGRGGDGGDGGSGGDGGHGGGAGGGISFAIYQAGTSTVSLDGATTLTAGSGGAGGTAPMGGNNGQAGNSGDKNF
ncbi:MAG: Ig-like domain-containing protein [Gemmatimonadetes bacterium]|uniref:Ig-like domain-containing protein n=1 Tax=Candidatus Kutchimonas denitrificans TaxID=3056748 RepID=A0AAE4Z9R9_9BACT|nr:Ig-like domain-containing protein [Gemmatimonadota bacterium]NIR75889.1 Ig-like domain-containing protein [Candidatus Kutchimonas denitrificans]NIS02050.1 Ig-like domain-containing protein [Gemmatimonadota bacterium]NIT67856.1 Ig-like domain-containing protein [Gemmatimonadota bacterium]NIU53835.1 PE-PGRS family protein [Gemmatimonadota bacterium]